MGSIKIDNLHDQRCSATTKSGNRCKNHPIAEYGRSAVTIEIYIKATRGMKETRKPETVQEKESI